MVLVNKGLQSACYNNCKQVPKSEVRLCKHLFQNHSLQIQAECNLMSDLSFWTLYYRDQAQKAALV